MKVLQIISGNDNGGGGNHVLNICTENNKFECVLGCIGDGPLHEKAKEKGINTVLFENKFYNKDISDYISDNGIDVVNFHGAKAFLTHLIIKHSIKIPSAATVHSDYRYDFLNSRIKYIFYTPLSKIGLRSFDHFICVSKYIKNLLEDKGFKGEKIKIDNGIQIKDAYLNKSREKLRNELKISRDSFVYIMVARMHPIKNHRGVLKAFHMLSKQVSGIKMVFVGDGILENDLKEMVKQFEMEDKVIFCGYQSDSFDYINASDISVLASFNEGGTPPLSILESGLLKKAAICSRVGDLEEFISEDNGYLIDPNSTEDIYEKMKSAYESRYTLPDMGEKLYNLVVSNYTIEKFQESYYNFYLHMCKSEL